MSTALPPLATALAEPLSSVDQLLSLIVPPLARLGLLHDRPALLSRFPPPAAEGSDDTSRFLKRQLGLVQKVLVERVWPDWHAAVVAEEGEQAAQIVFERWFVPPSYDSLDHQQVALSAYAVLLSLLSPRNQSPLQRRSLELVTSLLARLASAFSLEQVFAATVGPSTKEQDVQAVDRWDRTVKDLLNLPTKVANAWGSLAEKGAAPSGRVGASIPDELEWSTYFGGFTRSYADLIWSISTSAPAPSTITILSTPLSALVSSPAFLPSLLPVLIPLLLPPTTLPAPTDELIHRRLHAETWRNVIEELSEKDLTRLVRQVLSALHRDLLGTQTGDSRLLSQRVRASVFVLRQLFGPLEPSDELWKVALPIVLEEGAAWDAERGGLARVCLGWVGDEVETREALLNAVMAAWSRPDAIKTSSESNRTFLTTMLLIVLHSLPPLHPSVVTLSRSPLFLSAISAHLSLIQPTTRLLGMLVAELVSAATIPPSSELTPLSFGEEMWAGEELEKQVARRVRTQVLEKDAASAEGWQELLRTIWGPEASTLTTSSAPEPASIPQPTPPVIPPTTNSSRPLISVIADPDDLQPYPLPAPPTASVLSALASDDASLYSTALPSTSASSTRKRGKLRAPVYIPELVAYLRGTDPEGKKEEADGEAERIEVGLREGEGLVRRKTGWGGELDENAVDLAFALIVLQDTYEVDNFEHLKLGILSALVAAVPTKVAPTLVEQFFFNNYSVAQRHTILTALAVGARELSGLPRPPQLALQSPASVDLFPSKRLPPALHHRFAEGQQQIDQPKADTIDVLTAELTQTALSSAKEGAEATIPEASREKLLTVRRFASAKSATTATFSTKLSFPALAAEFFILPLINRFWLFLRDTASAPASGPYSSGRSGVGASGSSSLLSPLILSKYLSTVSLLVHASRNSHYFLLSIVPAVLQLAVALRSTVVDETDAKVLETEMELLLVTLDGVIALDGGESLMGRSVEGGSELVGEVKEWAEETFELEEARNKGGAGMGRAGRASAGVLLRIEEIMSRWRGRVGW